MLKMFPGMNPRQLKQLMRQMGMSMEDIDAEEVIIKTGDKEYVFKEPEVQIMKVQGKETFQIVGDYKIRDREISINISEDDIKTVVEQANVDEETAKKELEKTKGDIAQAIVNLSENS